MRCLPIQPTPKNPNLGSEVSVLLCFSFLVSFMTFIHKPLFIDNECFRKALRTIPSGVERRTQILQRKPMCEKGIGIEYIVRNRLSGFTNSIGVSSKVPLMRID